MAIDQDRIHVLQVVAGLAIGEPLGGAELFGAELARHFDPSECRPILCAVWRRGGTAEQYWCDLLRKAGVEVFFGTDFRGQFSFPAFLQGVRNIAAYLAGRQVDIIHSHFQVGSLASLMIKRRVQAQGVLRTAHITLEWGPTLPGFLCRQIFTKWLFPYAFDAEAGVSRAVAQQLDDRPGERLLCRSEIFVPSSITLDSFVDVSSPSNDQLVRMGLSPEKLTVGSVGRLTEQKGYDYLLQAVPAILSKRKDVQFVLIGDGDLDAVLRARVHQLGVADHVHFLGSRQDVESLLRAMDLFVLPSLWEGLPTVVMEAMASHVPIVATDIRGTRELVEHGRTGWLVEPKNPEGLAAAILEALDHPEVRREMARRALDEVVPRYAMTDIARQYVTIYRSLLSRPKVRQRERFHEGGQ